MFIYSFAMVSQDLPGVCGTGSCSSGMVHRKSDSLVEARQKRLYDYQKL